MNRCNVGSTGPTGATSMPMDLERTVRRLVVGARCHYNTKFMLRCVALAHNLDGPEDRACSLAHTHASTQQSLLLLVGIHQHRRGCSSLRSHCYTNLCYLQAAGIVLVRYTRTKFSTCAARACYKNSNININMDRASRSRI